MGRGRITWVGETPHGQGENHLGGGDTTWAGGE